MTITVTHTVAFELPTAKPSTMEYRYNPVTHITEVWCVVYYMVGGQRTIGDSTYITHLHWLPMNEAGIDYLEEAKLHFNENYAPRRWSEQSAPDTALGFIPTEQWL